MTLDEIYIILARPSESGNIGALCRAMKNMGLSRLRIIAPEESLDTERIKARAVHAYDVFEAAQFFPSLNEAIADCTLVVGTTRRRGQRRKERSLPPKTLASYLKESPGPAALVFGNERTGLERKEIDLCSLVSHIPVSQTFPSINLSHAVQIYAWELSQALGPHPAQPDLAFKGIDRLRQEELVGLVLGALEGLGFYKQAGKADQEVFFTDLIARARLSGQEAIYLEKILQKARALSPK